jgi:hypothetical protein
VVVTAVDLVMETEEVVVVDTKTILFLNKSKQGVKTPCFFINYPSKGFFFILD